MEGQAAQFEVIYKEHVPCIVFVYIEEFRGKVLSFLNAFTNVVYFSPWSTLPSNFEWAPNCNILIVAYNVQSEGLAPD